MHLLLEADGLAEARAKDGGCGLNIGSQGRVTEQILRGILGGTPTHWPLTIASGKTLKLDGHEQKCLGGRTIRKAWLPRPPLFPFGNRYTIIPVRIGLEHFVYPAVLKAAKADLIHYSQRFPLGREPLASREIWTALDLHPFYNPSREVKAQIKQLGERLRHVEVLAISQATAVDLVRILHIPEDRIQLHYLAVDRDIFGPAATISDDRFREIYQLPERFFFYAGALYNRKNVITLLQAVEHLNEISGQPPLPLIAAGGKGWPTPREDAIFKETAERLANKGYYRHLGRVTDAGMAILHRNCLAYVHPATLEGFGMTILEAMSCGAPVVCGKTTAMAEVGGDAACYTDDVLDAKGLALTLQRIARATPSWIAEQREKCLEQAAKFSWSRFQNGVAEMTAGRQLASCGI